MFQGTPQVQEHFVDSKRDVDGELKKTCEEFIRHVSDMLTEPVNVFLSRVCQNLPSLLIVYLSFVLAL